MTTSTAEIILNLLINHENEWVSGQELAASLNLSRDLEGNRQTNC